MCEMIACAETPYVAPAKKLKVKEGEESSSGAGTDGNAAASEPAQAPQFQYTVRWTALMKQQLLKVDLCVLRWVESENRRRKAMTVDDKKDEGFEATRTAAVPSLVISDEQAKVLCRLVDAFPHGNLCKGATIKDLRGVLARERLSQKKKVEQGREPPKTIAKSSGSCTTSVSDALAKGIEVEILEDATAASTANVGSSAPVGDHPAVVLVPTQQWQPVKAFDYDDFRTLEQSLAAKNALSES